MSLKLGVEVSEVHAKLSVSLSAWDQDVALTDCSSTMPVPCFLTYDNGTDPLFCKRAPNEMLSFKRFTVIVVSLHINKVTRTEGYLLRMPFASLTGLLLASSDLLVHRPEGRQVKVPEICAPHKSCVSHSSANTRTPK